MDRYSAHTYQGYSWIMDRQATLQRYGRLDGPTVPVETADGKTLRFRAIRAAMTRAAKMNKAV